jgi:hypothetical protein
VRTFWQTNQADDARLREIVGSEFEGPLDLVIDDASHWLKPTKASFVTLFPSLRQGGVYVVEDWGWHLVPEVRRGFPAGEPGLVPLINDLLPLSQREPSLLASFDLRDGLFAIERGPMPEAEAHTLLTSRLAPRYGRGPPLLKRAVRSSVAWRMLRRVVRRTRA